MAQRKEKFPRHVAVHWLDAVLDADGDDENNREPADAITSGFIIELKAKRADGEEYLRIAGEIFADGSYRSVTSIPYGMIRTIVAKPVKLPKAFEGWEANL